MKYQTQMARRNANRERDMEMYRLWLSNEYSLREIGERYGVSAARVDQVVKRIAAERRQRSPIKT